MQIQDQVIFDSLTKTAKIMRDGIYFYRASEVGDTSRSPSDIVKVNRDKKEVEKAYKRFQELSRLPLTIHHPENFVDLSDENSFKEGVASDPSLSQVASYTTLDCKITMNDAASALYHKGIKQLSCGWSGNFRKVEGKDYDYEQEFVDFNHIAILPDGRAGSLCSIVDNNSTLIDLMSTENLEKLEKSLTETIQSGIKDALGALLKKKKKKTEDESWDEEDEEDLEDKKTKDAAIAKEAEEKAEAEKKAIADAAAIKDAVDVAVKDARASLVSEFAAVFDAVEKGIVGVKDCAGKEPEEIKRAVVEKLLNKKIDDKAVLDAHYSVAVENYSNAGWSPNPAKIVKDAKESLANAINNINFFNN